MKREDTQPWYRQFWPWFIISLPAASVIGGLTTVWISLQTTDSLVIQSEDGIRNASDRRIAAERFASQAGLAALVDIDPDTGVVSATQGATRCRWQPALGGPPRNGAQRTLLRRAAFGRHLAPHGRMAG